MDALPESQEMMAKENGALDAQIDWLLKSTRTDANDTFGDTQEYAECLRLQCLSVATTSGDTLIIVTFPAGHYVDCNGHKWESKEFLMESHQLLATGSSVFEELLSPAGQEQARRRIRSDAVGAAHPGVKYVLDMTPPMVDDESASLVARLSLSDGVRNWWRSCLNLQVSPYVASGHDDYCPRHIAVLISDSETSYEHGSDGHVDLGEIGHPKSRDIDDYCPIRHRAAILRLLMAIRHGNLILNSAPRLATIALVAKQYDCVKVVSDAAFSWFMMEPNHSFIDINAEDAFGIAWVLELPDIARVAFRVLVVERAFEILDDNAAMNTDRRRKSLFGRPRGRNLIDEQETCIQHAAQRLAQRAKDLLTKFMTDDAHLHLGITDWPRGDPALCKDLCGYLRGTIDDAMDASFLSPDETRAVDLNRARYAPTNVIACELMKDIYPKLSRAQRMLTTTFWTALRESATMDRLQIANVVGSRDSQVDVQKFQGEFAASISRTVGRWMFPELEVNIQQSGPLTLRLAEVDFSYLPLWAGGLDDGTGAVYQPEIPDAEGGGVPMGPGPGFYTGGTIGESDVASMLSGDTADAATVATGTYTDSVTLGYSVNAAPSLATSAAARWDLDDSLLTSSMTGLWPAPATALAIRDRLANTAIATTQQPSSQSLSAPSHDAFDLSTDFSDDDQDMSHFEDDSDFDSDDTEQADNDPDRRARAITPEEDDDEDEGMSGV